MGTFLKSVVWTSHCFDPSTQNSPHWHSECKGENNVMPIQNFPEMCPQFLIMDALDKKCLSSCIYLAICILYLPQTTGMGIEPNISVLDLPLLHLRRPGIYAETAPYQQFFWHRCRCCARNRHSSAACAHTSVSGLLQCSSVDFKKLVPALPHISSLRYFELSANHVGFGYLDFRLPFSLTHLRFGEIVAVVQNIIGWCGALFPLPHLRAVTFRVWKWIVGESRFSLPLFLFDLSLSFLPFTLPLPQFSSFSLSRCSP